MQPIQRIGGYAALIQAVLLIVLTVMFGVVLPSQGFLPNDFGDFSKVVPVMSTFNIVNLVAVLRSFVFLLIVLGVRERTQTGSLARMPLAMIGAVVASTLLLAQGMMGLLGWPILLQHPSDAPTAGLALQAVSQSLISGATVAEGWTVLLFGWAAWTSKTLPAPLSSLVMASGVLALLEPVIGIALLPAIALFII
jgi:hypothetical protein